MERVREDLIRRALSERYGDIEQGLPPSHDERHQEQQQMEERPGPSRFGQFPRLSRPAVPRFFGGRGREDDIQERVVEHPRAEVVESPKSPEFNVRASGSRLTRFTLPNMSRVWSHGFNRAGSHPHANQDLESQTSLPHQGASWDLPVPPEPVTHASSTMRAASSRYSITEDSSQPTTQQSSRNRHHRRRHGRRKAHRRHDRRRRHKKNPRRFLFCFPWVKSRRMRAYILRCFVSGLFLFILLTVCMSPPSLSRKVLKLTCQIDLALSVSGQIRMGEFTIVLILVVILATLIFCYGLIKLCMLTLRKDRARQDQMSQDPLGQGYAVPQEPIRVVLARDEEAAGLESEASKMTPPAYGLWRESVVCDDFER